MPLEKRKNGYWEKTLEFEKRTNLAYKITRGSWETEEALADGTVRGNRYHTVKKHHIIDIKIDNWRDVVFKAEGGITGNIRYHQDFEAKHLRYKRTLAVWLPPAYETFKRKRYPVLYMHDGQNIFDPVTAFGGVEWQMDETADQLIKERKIEEIIVVGIYNTPDRLKEYADTSKGRRYMQFLVNEVKPFIDKTYRTRPEREHTAVMGSSMGGLISLYLVWRYSIVFSKAGCLSSTLSWRHGEVLNMIKNEPEPSQPIYIYFDHGGVGEGLVLPYFRKLRQLLLKSGYRDGADFECFFDKKGDHSERAWAKRIWRPLIFMFGIK